MATACIALGSNLGHRSKHLREAVAAIAALEGVGTVQSSSVYETEPVGGPAGQDAFLNSAVRVETSLAPGDLLAKLLEIEKDAGRPNRQERAYWGPRPLDLDLLLYDERLIDELGPGAGPGAGAGLVVPHPRMHERAFVLQPLAEIAGEMMHPLLGKTVAQLLEQLDLDA